MTEIQSERPTVVVVGGGYGGTAAAKALDENFNVVLVEPKDAFMHNIAALRALVDPSWLPRIFIPYGGLLKNGRVVQDRASTVNPGLVTTATGEAIAADYIVLATGSSYPFPAKTDQTVSKEAFAQVHAAHEALTKADRVLLIGAGPVGIELAGEIRAVWPDKSIVLLDERPEILSGPYLPELRRELQRQLEELKVELVLGSPLVKGPEVAAGELGAFTVTKEDGTQLHADIWFRCYGVVPNSDFFGEVLQPARRSDGFIEVTPTMQVLGQTSVFAIGDLSTADTKMAAHAGRQAATVAANINALAFGNGELTDYESMGLGIAIPIGPEGGAGQFPGQTEIVGAATVSEVKGQHMMVDRFSELFSTSAED